MNFYLAILIFFFRNCEFLSRNSDFFFAIVNFYLAIQIFFLQLWISISQFLFFFCNCIFFLAIANFYLVIQILFFCNCKFLSHNSDFFLANAIFLWLLTSFSDLKKIVCTFSQNIYLKVYRVFLLQFWLYNMQLRVYLRISRKSEKKSQLQDVFSQLCHNWDKKLQLPFLFFSVVETGFHTCWKTKVTHIVKSYQEKCFNKKCKTSWQKIRHCFKVD